MFLQTRTFPQPEIQGFYLRVFTVLSHEKKNAVARTQLFYGVGQNESGGAKQVTRNLYLYAKN